MNGDSFNMKIDFDVIFRPEDVGGKLPSFFVGHTFIFLIFLSLT